MPFALVLALLLTSLTSAFAPAPAGAATAKSGYWMVATDGGIFAFGDAAFKGSTGNIKLNKPIVGMAATPSGNGYWLVATDGGIFAFGDAVFYGSTGDKKLNQPIVGMSPTASGKGYWLVASDGGIFAFGDALFYGSTGDKKLNKPIVGMATTAGGKGYWLVATDGGIFAFGDAVFYGSTGDKKLNQPVVGMEPTATGRGYWMTASDGGMFSFGDAVFYGSTGDKKLNKPVVGMAASQTGKGYWLVATDGGIFAFGDAEFKGSTGNIKLAQPVVGMAAVGSVTRPPIGFIGDKPKAFNDGGTTQEDIAVTIDVLANDTGLSDTPVKVTSTNPPSHGSIAVTNDNKVTYTPSADFYGADTFGYWVTDKDGDAAFATVAIQVLAVNDTPSAQPDPLTIAKDTVAVVQELANDTGLGDGIGGIDLGPIPSTAEVVLNADGTLTVTPDTSFTGTITFTYTVTDADGESSTGTVTITVSPLAAVNDAYSTSSGSLTVAAAGVLTNDIGTGLTTQLGTSVTHGSLTLAADGGFTYTATSGFTGVDSFTYQAKAGSDLSNPARVTIVVGNTDHALVVTPDAVSVRAETAVVIDVLANDVVKDGVAKVEITESANANGTVTVNPDYTIAYRPAAAFTGTATFTYKVTDSDGSTASATVTATVTANVVAFDDAYLVNEDGTLTVTAALGVLKNDVGTGLTASLVTGPTQGTLNLNANGSFTYTPAADFYGQATFTYRATDGSSNVSNAATVRINVTPVNDTPVAVPDVKPPYSVTATGSTSTVIAVLANDEGLGDGGIQVLLGATAAAHGTVTVNDDNTITYTANAGFVGADTFTYKIRDANGDVSAEAIVTVAVTL
jgi:hypothetical protein